MGEWEMSFSSQCSVGLEYSVKYIFLASEILLK